MASGGLHEFGGRRLSCANLVWKCLGHRAHLRCSGFEMKKESPCAWPIRERLALRNCASSEARSPLRKVKDVSMPVKGVEPCRQPAEEAISLGCLFEDDFVPAQLFRRSGVDPGSEHGREKLTSKAQPERGALRLERFLNQPHLVSQARMTVSFIHAHWAAEDDESRCMMAPVWRHNCVGRHELKINTALSEQRFDPPESLSQDVLNDDHR